MEPSGPRDERAHVTGRPPVAPPRTDRGRRRARPSTRRRFLYRFVPLLVTLLVLVTAVAWLVSRHSGDTAAAGTPTTRGVATHRTTAPAPTTVPAPATTTTTAPPTPTSTTNPAGALPQTTAYPAASTAQFQAEMASLWHGVVSNSVAPAMAAFFPEQAYLQLKSIANAAGDFENRLVAQYTLDIGAAHAVLGTDPQSATLVGVNVPLQYGHWVPPGVCTNSIGYFEVANSRVVYRQGGVTKSFGIASLISWRGMWYVVHLGAILRTTNAGVVLDPATGPGTSAPSTTC